MDGENTTCLLITCHFVHSNISENSVASFIYSFNLQAAFTSEVWVTTYALTQHRVPENHGPLSSKQPLISVIRNVNTIVKKNVIGPISQRLNCEMTLQPLALTSAARR